MWSGKHQIAALAKQLEDAELRDFVVLPGEELRALLNLVDKIKSPEAWKLQRVRALSHNPEVCLFSAEISVLLTLAIQAKFMQSESRRLIITLPVTHTSNLIARRSR